MSITFKLELDLSKDTRRFLYEAFEINKELSERLARIERKLDALLAMEKIIMGNAADLEAAIAAETSVIGGLARAAEGIEARLKENGVNQAIIDKSLADINGNAATLQKIADALLLNTEAAPVVDPLVITPAKTDG